MSFPGDYLANKQVLRRQKVALLMRLRQNFLLKCISLATSILLFVFVQQERNPTVSRTLVLPITLKNLRSDVEVETDQQQVEVAISGPRPVVDAVKEGYIHVVADLNGIQNDKVTTEKIRLQYDLRNLPEDMKRELTFDPQVLPRLQVQEYPQQVRTMTVEAHFSLLAPAGFRYGRPEIRPSKVKISGRLDRLNRIDQVVVNATPLIRDTTIDGDYEVSARDNENNPIEGVTIKPNIVHVTIPLMEEPYSKIVSVSPTISDQPLPTYRLVNVTVTPGQVKIVGRPERVNQISTLTTEDIAVHDLMESQTLAVPLKMPSDVTVLDLSGRPISKVKVQITIRKTDPSPTSTPSDHSPNPSGPGPASGGQLLQDSQGNH
jgi:YbbR domain-containing protein